jgi:hypothetical protein
MNHLRNLTPNNKLNRRWATLLIVGLLFFVNLVAASGSMEDENSSCSCFRGIGSVIGDTPAMAVAVGDSSGLAVCGFTESKIDLNKIIMSEFDVFDCQNGNSIARYSSSERVQIEFKNSVLHLSEMQGLPIGVNWEWRDVVVTTRKISVDAASKDITDPEWVFDSPLPDKRQITVFLNQLESLRKNKNKVLEHIEEIIGKLVVTSITGDKSAEKILLELEQYLDMSFDGASMEYYQQMLGLLFLFQDNERLR